MDSHAFDALQTRQQLRAALEETIAAWAGPSVRDIPALLEIGNAELSRKPKAFSYLCQSCRLLIRLGDAAALRFVSKLAPLIYSLERSQHASHRLSDLYKGLSQIGLGVTNFGLRKVSHAVAGLPHTNEGSPQDRVLAFWGLTGAAVALRNLALAAKLAAKWQQAARQESMQAEALRATLVLHIFRLIEARENSDLLDAERLLETAPNVWQAALRLVQVWTLAARDAPLPDIVACLQRWPRELQAASEFACAQSILSEPTAAGDPGDLSPLFLGPDLDWCTPGRPLDGQLAGGFAEICRIRQQLCRPDALAGRSLAQLQALARVLASWELGRPHKRVELTIKQRDPERYYQSVLARLVGDHVRSYVINESLGDTEIVPRDDVLIWMCDVRGYSTLVAELPPEGIFEILSPLFKIMHEELGAVGGVIHEFVGDAIMVVFNGYGACADLLAILTATARCLRRIFYLGSLRLHAGEMQAEIGVGINKGPVAIGYLGGRSRCQLANLGNTVNVAARLEGCTRLLPCPVVLSAGVFENGRPEVWKTPRSVGFGLRDLPDQTLKNIPHPCAVIGLSPLVRSWVEFFAETPQATPEPGVVYIGVGRSIEPGILDTQAAESAQRSHSQLLLSQPELLLDHLADQIRAEGGADFNRIEFRLSEDPNLDKVSCLYIAYELLAGQPRRALLQQLAAYVSEIEQGYLSAHRDLTTSLYGVFMAHKTAMEKDQPPGLQDFVRVEAGLRVLDAAMFIAARMHPARADFGSIFAAHGFFPQERAQLKTDLALYRQDCRRGHRYEAHVGGRQEKVAGVWLSQPASLFFKVWARNDPDSPGGKGFGFMVVDWSHAQKNIFVISVDPASGTHLRGLGARCDALERARRLDLREPPGPWNHGAAYGHTILLPPKQGTVLTAQEVQALHEAWDGCP